MSVVYHQEDPLTSFQSASDYATSIIVEDILLSYKSSSSSLSSATSQGLKKGQKIDENISEIFSDVPFSSRNNIDDKSIPAKGGTSYSSSLSTTTSSSSSSSSSFSLSSASQFDISQQKVTHVKMLITPMYSKFPISKKVKKLLR